MAHYLIRMAHGVIHNKDTFYQTLHEAIKWLEKTPDCADQNIQIKDNLYKTASIQIDLIAQKLRFP